MALIGMAGYVGVLATLVGRADASLRGGAFLAILAARRLVCA